MRPRISTRHPPQILPIINNKIRKRKLVRVEQERRDAQCRHRDPEVDEMRHPDGHRDVEQHDERAHAEIDAGAREARVEDAERDAGGREAAPGGDIPCTTEREIAEDGMRLDLRREYLKEGR